MLSPTLEVTSVRSKAPRRLSLSWTACQALIAIEPEWSGIDHQIGSLSEAVLSGFRQGTGCHGSYEDEASWMSVAEQARRRATLATPTH